MVMKLVGWASVALVAFGLGSARADEPPPVKVRLGIVTTASQAAFMVGVERGIFRKHGFDVAVTPLASGAQANQALAAGQVDWSGGGIEPTVIAWATGLPVKAYAMYAKGGDSYGILVRNEANIRTPADLQGKKVAVAQGTATAQGLNQVLRKANLPVNAVQRVNASFGNMGQLLVQGSVDAMVGLEPFLSTTQEAMGDKATLLMRLGKEVQGGGFFLVSNGWAEANPGRVAAAVTALWEAEQWLRRNRDEGGRTAASFLKVEPRQLDAAFRTLTYDPVVDDFTRESLASTAEFLAQEGFVTTKVDVGRHLTDLDAVEKQVRAARGDLLE